MVLLEAQGVYRMLAHLGVPLLPKTEVPELLNGVALGHRDFCGRLVGVRGEQHGYLAADTLGEQRHRLGVKRGDEMLFVYCLEVFGYRTGNFDIARSERHAAERRVKNVVLALKQRHPRVFAAVFLPRLFGDDELPAVLVVLAVKRERFADTRDAGGRHQRIGPAKRAIQQVRDGAFFNRRGVKRAARLPVLVGNGRDERVVR